MKSAVIPSFSYPKNQLNVSTWSWYGKLLRQYVRTDDPDLITAFGQVKNASEKSFLDLKKRISDPNMNIAFPGTKISFQFNPESRQDIYKNALIYVDDGYNSLLQDKGSGIQSAVIIGLFDFYVKEIAHSAGSSLLAIEEPELYLHPHGRRVISDRINQFLDGNKNQVILTTHSPEFISSIDDQNIIIVKKNDSATIVKEIYFSLPKRKQILIKKQNAEMFFADYVILTEGADKYLLERMAEEIGSKTNIIDPSGRHNLLGRSWLNDYNVSIINCGGKFELVKYADVLSELNIPFIVIADFDFFRDGLSEYLTNLRVDGSVRDVLNSIKSKCNLSTKSPIKRLDDVDKKYRDLIVKYLVSLSLSQNIFILSSELEDYYKIHPRGNKEQGIIETISSMIENGKPISDYIITPAFEEIFKRFISKLLGFRIQG